MARGVQTDLDLGGHTLLGARVESLSAAPASPDVGRVYFDTTLGQLRTWTGAAWSTGGSAQPADMVTTDTAQTITGAKTVTAPAGTVGVVFVPTTGQGSDLLQARNQANTATQTAITAAGGVWTQVVLRHAAANATSVTRTTSSAIDQFDTYYWSGTAAVLESVAIQAQRGSTTAGDLWLNVNGSLRATSLYDNGNRVYSASNPPPAQVVPGQTLYVSATQPAAGTPTPYLWVQTLANGDVSFWVEDGR